MNSIPHNRRRSIRLRGYDYSQEGGYFVTICTQDKEPFFGKITCGEMLASDAGLMIEKLWHEIPNAFPQVENNDYIIMPNHIHGIISISGFNGQCGLIGQGEHAGSPLPKMIQWFKTMATNAYIRGVKENGWAPFNRRLWQRNYYEHIIRNENELNSIRKYISNNVLDWEFDEENSSSG